MTDSDLPDLTMCLCNYARRDNLDKIITDLRRQTVNLRIFVWNNDTENEFKDDRVDWVINSSQNVHTRHVIYLWQQANSPYVARMDDDLTFADDDVLADALVALKRLPYSNQILGAYGVRLWTGDSYVDGHHISTPKGHGQKDDQGNILTKTADFDVDLIKGRIMLLKQSASHSLSTGFGHVHTDLHISTQLAVRTRYFHVVSGIFYNLKDLSPRLIEFDVDDEGYCDLEGHYDKRNKLSQSWVVTCHPSRKVRVRPHGSVRRSDLENENIDK